MDKQKEIDKRYLRMAFIWSENSYAIRRKVGCLMVKDNRIISDGWNGTPSGFPNVCEYAEDSNGEKHEYLTVHALERDTNYHHWNLRSYPYVLHAEANAITKLAKFGGSSSKGATIYITDSPCVECSKLIIQAGIKRIVYSRAYRDISGIQLLDKAGIEIIQITEEELRKTTDEEI